MIMLLDDPSPLVRRALAEALAGSADAPHAVIHALASDHADIAALVLARSPLLIDAELVDVVASGSCDLQTAIASRVPLQSAVAAAIAEAGALSRPASLRWKIPTRRSRRPRSIASSPGSDASAPSARRCSRAPTCRWRRDTC